MGIGKNGLGTPASRLLACLAAFGLGLFGLSPVQRFWLGAPQVVAIQQIPDVGDSCYRPSSDEEIPNASRTLNLLAAFDELPVYAQDNGGGVGLTRPPVRNIWDTAPTFSSIGVDSVRNEVYLGFPDR
jgi:hypothetical protein